MKEDICECIKSPNDKELILISLDENIRHEEKEIIGIRTKEEEILTSDFIDMDKIKNLEERAVLHEDRIEEIKSIRTKLENTRAC